MHTLHIDAPGQPAWREAPRPTIRPSEILLRISGVTTCPQWDLHVMDGEPMFADRPFEYPYVAGEPGHEAVGWVEEIGAEVEGFEIGQRVVVWRDPGGRRQGCYAEFAPVEAAHALSVSEDLPDDALAPLELAMCVQVSFDQLAQRGGFAGQTVGVSGLGPAGLIAVQMAKAYGAREVVGLDLVPERRDLALKLGADRALHPDALPEGRDTFSAALDTTGLPVAIHHLMARTERTVAIFGVLREPVVFGPELWWGDFALVGYGAHNRGAAERALALVEARRLDLAALVTHRLPLSRYAEGVELLRSREAIKVLFSPR